MVAAVLVATLRIRPSRLWSRNGCRTSRQTPAAERATDAISGQVRDDRKALLQASKGSIPSKSSILEQRQWVHHERALRVLFFQQTGLAF